MRVVSTCTLIKGGGGTYSKPQICSPSEDIKHVWDVESDGEVVEPVGGSGDGSTLSTDGEWEDLRDQSPGDWTPGGTERGDINPDESNTDPSGSNVLWPRVLELRDDNGDDNHRKQHNKGADKQHDLTSDLIDD